MSHTFCIILFSYFRGYGLEDKKFSSSRGVEHENKKGVSNMGELRGVAALRSAKFSFIVNLFFLVLTISLGGCSSSTGGNTGDEQSVSSNSDDGDNGGVPNFESNVSPASTVVLVNDASLPITVFDLEPDHSVQVAAYFQDKYQIPEENMIHIRITPEDVKLGGGTLLRSVFEREIESRLATLGDHINLVVTTWPAPFRVGEDDELKNANGPDNGDDDGNDGGCARGRWHCHVVNCGYYLWFGRPVFSIC